MLQDLYLINLNKPYSLPKLDPKSYFVLSTCQRNLVLTLKTSFNSKNSPFPIKDLLFNDEFTVKEGIQAYQYILEVICGLKSRLIGESEVMGQFRKTYSEFQGIQNRDTNLLRILEKAILDAKKIKSTHLVGLGQKTYSNITRKLFHAKKCQEILILGSGQLATELIGQFRKNTKIYLCARNQEKSFRLSKEFSIEIVPWNFLAENHSFPFIANTIGTEQVLLNQSFFDQWKERNCHADRLFVDLGSPSIIQTKMDRSDHIIRLEDILKHSELHDAKKKIKLKDAQEDLIRIAQMRHSHLSQRKSAKKLISQPV
ncbi:hypothetical protein N9N67_03665 [Bacteriovoracaceae bacterium]|nr:hypothetical protein [Bacteriovoracaceae bacterium]